MTLNCEEQRTGMRNDSRCRFCNGSTY